MKLAYCTYLAVGVATLVVAMAISRQVARSEVFPAGHARTAELAASEAENDALFDDVMETEAIGDLPFDDELLALGGLDAGRFLCELSEYNLGLSVNESSRLWRETSLSEFGGIDAPHVSAAAVPEPMSLSLLCVGAVALLRRRRQKA